MAVRRRLARLLYDLADWLASPYVPARDPAAVEAGRTTFIEAAAANFGEGQARKQLAAGLIAAQLATGEKASRGGVTNGHIAPHIEGDTAP